MTEAKARNAHAVCMVGLNGQIKTHPTDGLSFDEFAEFREDPRGEGRAKGKYQPPTEAQQRSSACFVVERRNTFAQIVGRGGMIAEKQQRRADPVVCQASQFPAIEFLRGREPAKAELDGDVMLALDPV